MPVALAAALYSVALGSAPVALGGDEAHFGVQAHAIANRGRTLDGRAMPLFVHLADPQGDPLDPETTRRWYQPALFYLTALVLRVVPLSEAAVRAPSALIGVLNAALMYLVARRLFGSPVYATLTGLMLVLTPAHLIFSRQATDYLAPVAFVLGWLWCVLAFLDRRHVPVVFAAGLILGLGFYSYIAAWILMPALLVLTCLALIVSRGSATRGALAAAVGFALPVLPLIGWLALHPDMLRETLGRYPVSGAAIGFNTLQEKVSVYWDYFNPSFLFLSGGASLTATTGRAGVFLVALAPLLPPGIYALLTRTGSGAPAVLLIGGFLLAAVPAAMLGERDMIQRALLVLPFGVLIAAFGMVWLLSHPSRLARGVATALLVAMPLQFAYTARDYFGEYRRRSAFYFDPTALKDASEYLMAADASSRAPAVYLSRQLDDATARYRFYLAMHHHEELLARTRYFDGDGLDLASATPGTFIVIRADGPILDALGKTGWWSVEKTARRADGGAGSVILRKTH